MEVGSRVASTSGNEGDWFTGLVSVSDPTQTKLSKIAAKYDLQETNETQLRDMCCDAIIDDCQQNRWERLRTLREELPSLLDSQGSSVLKICIESNYEQAVNNIFAQDWQHLLAGGRDYREFALHLAAGKGWLNLCRMLLSRVGVNQDSQGETPLHRAILQGQGGVVKLLLQNQAKEKLRYSLKFGEQPVSLPALLLAVYSGQRECVDNLLAHIKEYNPNALTDTIPETGANALHVAIYAHRSGMLSHLVEKYPEMRQLIERKDARGCTPFILAAHMGDIRSLQLLYEYNAALRNTDNEGQTAMHWAVQARQRNAIQFLATVGNGILLDLPDSKGITPTRLAEGTPISELLAYLTNRDARLRTDLEIVTEEFPTALICKGGGTKALGLIGAYKALWRTGRLGACKHAVGNSAGALTAVCIALRIPPERVEDLLAKKPFTALLDFKGQRKATTSLAGIVGDTLVHALTEAIKLPFKEFVKKVWSSTGLCKGEALRLWVEERVFEQTKIKNCTFGELRRLIESGKSFMHLHVFVTRVAGKDARKPLCISSDDPKWDKAIISWAATASARFPGAFEPGPIKFKDDFGVYLHEKAAQYLDGGMLRNFPIEALDRRKYVEAGLSTSQAEQYLFNRGVLGLRLHSARDLQLKERKVATIGDVVSALFDIYLSAEQSIQEISSAPKHQIIHIDVGDTKTFDLKLDKQPARLARLIRSGERATDEYFKKMAAKSRPADIGSRARSYGFHNLSSQGVPIVKSLTQSRRCKLEKLLPPSEWRPTISTKRRILVGPPEVSVNAIATQFARDHLADFAFVWWIDGSSAENIMRDLRVLAQKLRIPLPARGEPHVKQAIRKGLEDFGGNKPWLLLYVDVQNIKDVVHPTRNGSLLITSANEIDSTADQIQIRQMTKQTGEQFFCQLSARESSQDMRVLTNDLLKNSPLALQIVASCLAQEEDLTVLDVKQAITNLLSKNRGKRDADRALSSAWQFAIERAACKSQHPKYLEQWLDRCAYLQPRKIPVSWLKEWIGAHMQGNRAQADAPTRILNSLKKYGLIEVDEYGSTYSIHPSLQETIRSQQIQHRAARLWFQDACQLLREMMKSFDRNEPADWTAAEHWLLQSECVTAQSIFAKVPRDLQYELHCEIGRVRHLRGDHRAACNAYQTAEDLLPSLSGDDRYRKVRLFILRGAAEVALNWMDKKAEGYCTQAQEEWQRLTGEGEEYHRLGLRAYFNLGSLFLRRQQLDKAFKFLSCAEDEHKNHIRKSPDLDYTNVMHQFGIYHELKDNLRRASQIYGHILGQQRGIHSSEFYPEFARGYNNLGLVQEELGLYDRALDCFNRSLAIKQVIFRSPSKLISTQSNIGLIHFHLGEYRKALNVYRMVEDTAREVHFAGNHSTLARCLKNTGLALIKLNQLKKAARKLREAQLMEEKIGDKSYLADIYNAIGKLLKRKGLYDKAYQKCEQAHKLRLEMYGSDNSRVAESLQALSSIRRRQGRGRSTDAAKLQQRAIGIWEKAFKKNTNHPVLAQAFRRLGDIHAANQNESEALAAYEKALQICGKLDDQRESRKVSARRDQMQSKGKEKVNR